jgi:hypothetical protein
MPNCRTPFARAHHCDIRARGQSATDRLGSVDRVGRVVESAALDIAQRQEGGDVMGLLLVFLVSLVAGQAIAVSLGLLVERQYSPYAGLVTFIALYFVMFWVAWKFAVRITEPGTRLGAWFGSNVEK